MGEVLRKGQELKSKNRKLKIIEVGTLTIAMFTRHVSADPKDVDNLHSFQYHMLHSFQNFLNFSFEDYMKLKTKFEEDLNNQIFGGSKSMPKKSINLEFQNVNVSKNWLYTLRLRLEGLLHVTCKLFAHFEYIEPNPDLRDQAFETTLEIIKAVWDTLEQNKSMFHGDNRDSFEHLADMTYEYVRVAYTYRQMSQSLQSFINWVKARNRRGKNLLPFRPYKHVFGEALKNYPGREPFWNFVKPKH